MQNEHFNPKNYRGTTRFGARLYVHRDPRKAEKGYYEIDNSTHKFFGKPFYSSRTGDWLLILANAFLWFAFVVAVAEWNSF